MRNFLLLLQTLTLELLFSFFIGVAFYALVCLVFSDALPNSPLVKSQNSSVQIEKSLLKLKLSSSYYGLARKKGRLPQTAIILCVVRIV